MNTPSLVCTPVKFQGNGSLEISDLHYTSNLSCGKVLVFQDDNLLSEGDSQVGCDIECPESD